MWQRGVNSDVVLKLMGRSTGPSVGGGGPTGTPPSRGRGGGSMDRGRGRGRGLSSGTYNRGTSYEDDAAEHGRRDGPPTGYGRGARPFERAPVIYTIKPINLSMEVCDINCYSY